MKVFKEPSWLKDSHAIGSLSFFHGSLHHEQFSKEHPLAFTRAQTISCPTALPVWVSSASTRLGVRPSEGLVVEPSAVCGLAAESICDYGV